MHNQFEELCALAITGQITDSERVLLDEHVRGCEDCRSLLEELHGSAPQMAPALAELLLVNVEPPAGMRDRFLEQAADAGLTIRAGDAITAQSGQASAGAVDVSFWTRVGDWVSCRFVQIRLMPVSAAVACLGVACMVGSVGVYVQATRQRTVAELGSANRPYVQFVKPVVADAVPRGAAASDEKELRAEIAQLSSQLALQQAKESELESSKKQMKEQLSTTTQQTQSSAMEADAQRRLAQQTGAQVAALQQQLAETKTRIVQLDAVAAMQEQQTTEAQARVASLRAEMDQMYAARGTAETMISSRNLHIVDVYDNAGSSSHEGAFGRVFFVEGKSLVFYAYDLPKSKRKDGFSFQLWGEGRGAEPTTFKLGLMHPDNTGHGGWVVSCDDPKVLNQLNAVYIAPESTRGERPAQGQKRMYALLGSANHP
jgi:hypothetical protein